MELRYEKYRGAAIRTVFEPLAALRIRVFRDFPYLYEGTLDYELEYLNTYAQAERALLFVVYDGEKMVGATTCIPLSNETPDVQEPFLKAGYNLDEVFYFGESILLQEYRGHGIGHRFFNEREAHAASFDTYRFTCFCAVERPENHSLRPEGYRPLDAFWMQRGYRKEPALVSQFTWPDLGESTGTAKNMIYWIKPLP
ncbi:MAG TPA: GNAT family N-acetyltransferase [Saprospirales bacterium]|nr:GNAT family N-acetyltransferase [Saprospirales bacterium]